MKKLTLVSLGLMLALNIISQAPDYFSYQAVLRNQDGTPMVRQDVTIQVELLKGQIDSPSVYLESHEVRTNEQGIVVLKIGDPDFFSEIDWGMGPYFLSLTVNGVHMGTSQLLSVPYALYAKNAGNVDDADSDPTNEIQTLLVNETEQELSIVPGNTVTLPVSPWRVDKKPDIYFPNNVGIGSVAQPGFPLDIRKNVYGDHDMALIRLRNIDEGPTAYVGIALEAFGDLEERTFNRAELLLTSDEYNIIPSFRGMTAIRAPGSGFSVIADSTAGSIRFYTTDLSNTIHERLRITPEGYMGVGTSNPQAKIHIKDGDLYFEDDNRGMILTSPGGLRFRITVDDSGNLVTEQVIM
jgi:hypothetical protein